MFYFIFITLVITYFIFEFVGPQVRDLWSFGIWIGTNFLVSAIVFGIWKLLLKDFFQSLPWITNEVQKQKDIRKNVEVLPNSTALELALKTIRSSGHFDFQKAVSPPEHLKENLPGLVFDFFSRFDEVGEYGKLFELSTECIGPSVLRPGFIRIGYTGTRDVEILVNPTSEEVYEVDGMEEEDESIKPIASTIYHYVLFYHHYFSPEDALQVD